MADRSVVLSDPLCFVLSKYGKTQLKLLKTCVIDFYDVDTISEAKCQLLDDAAQLTLTDKLPHFPRRRDGDGRVTREIDDIISILNILDEQKMLNKLPRYVSENPDNMPAIRLFEGDLKFMLSWLEKSDCKLDSFSKQLDTITTQFLSIQSQLSTILKVQSTMSTAQQKQHTALHVDDQTVTLGNSHAASAVVNKNINTVSKQPWSSDVSTPLPRLSTMSSSATDNDGQDSQDDTPFLEAGWRRSKKRRRARSNGNQQQEPHGVDQPAQQTQQPKPSYATVARPRKQPLVIGKLTNTTFTTTASKLMAAKPMIPRIRKSVYCIDNVHNSVSVNDLCEFVENLSVKVISCFETKPRKRRLESDINDHKAFRLCIASEDSDRLLDSTLWPEFVSVYEWFFKSSNQQTSVPVIANANTSSHEDNLHDNVINDDMDATIITINNGV